MYDNCFPTFNAALVLSVLQTERAEIIRILSDLPPSPVSG